MNVFGIIIEQNKGTWKQALRQVHSQSDIRDGYQATNWQVAHLQCGCARQRDDSHPLGMEQDSARSPMLLGIQCNIKLTIIYFCNFPFNIFRLCLTETVESESQNVKLQRRVDDYNFLQHRSTNEKHGLPLGRDNISLNWGSKLVFPIIRWMANGDLWKPPELERICKTNRQWAGFGCLPTTAERY